VELGVKAHNLLNLVDYQEGSIVSRTLIQKDSGTVTLFAFDQGQGLSEHTTPFDAIVYVFDGKTEVTISGSSSILEKGDMIIMPADEPHALEAVGKFKMMLIMIRS
jgi:quercetin dioxygenase-like cupin family protein